MKTLELQSKKNKSLLVFQKNKLDQQNVSVPVFFGILILVKIKRFGKTFKIPDYSCLGTYFGIIIQPKFSQPPFDLGNYTERQICENDP